MAVLTKSIIGNLSGKLGNIVIKKRNGKAIAYVHVPEYRASKSAAAVEGRNNFAVTVKLAKSVNSVLVLKEIWNVSKEEGSNAYQKLIKSNVKLARQGSLTTLNKITPVGLKLKLISASFENKNLHLQFICPVKSNLKFPAVLFAYMYFEKEGKPVVPVFALLEEISPDGSYDVELILDTYTRKIISKDPNPVIYVALAGGEHYKRKIYWTSTAAVQI
jgi:hypothetical protein